MTAKSKKPAADYENLYVRTMPPNLANSKARGGIENLLPQDAIPDEMFYQHKRNKRSVGYNIDVNLDKMKLCKHLCEERRNPADFAEFAAVLNMIEQLVAPPAPQEPAPADPDPTA